MDENEQKSLIMVDKQAEISREEQRRRDKAKHLQSYRWPPGQSGNPKGRKKKSTELVDIIDEIMRWPILPEMINKLPQKYRKKAKKLGYILGWSLVSGAISRNKECLKVLADIAEKKIRISGNLDTDIGIKLYDVDPSKFPRKD